MQDRHHGSQTGWRGMLGHFVQHVRDDWPAAIFVAALFAVLDHSVGWLDAINGHGFVAIGNAAGMPAVRGEADARALVVLIDQAAAESRYLDRSPLDRCQLLADLGTVYSAMKQHRSDLLVVDLDLSPARWLLADEGKASNEARCQAELYRVIQDAAKTEPKVRTVLMAPFQAVDRVLHETQQAWRVGLEQSGVTFGNAMLPIKYGLVIKQYCGPGTLAGAAYALSMKNAAEKRKNDCSEPEHIDPRKYLSAVIPISVSAPPGSSRTLRERLDDAMAPDPGNGQPGERPARAGRPDAVFFGAAHGQGDTFITPLGELYGVEIHAAGFLTFLDPVEADNRLTELLVDIGYGFLFGMLIAFFWSRYFEFRLSSDSDHRLSAPFWLVGLVVTIVGLATLLTFISWLLLAYSGLWLSPIPMAIGMLIESFVSGSVAQGIREADNLKGQGRPRRLTFRESARKFFGGDIFLLARKGKKLSAVLMALRLGIWTAIVAAALSFALQPHLARLLDSFGGQG